jgi:hypothetical protein
MIGEQATRLSLYLYLANKFYTVHIIRCFGNSVETILYIMAFYYYYKIKNKFDKNMVIFTLIVTVAFMMRCTSPIGFIFLIIYKLFSKKSFKCFAIAGIFVALPTILFFIAFDSYYYGQFTFVPYNFYY